MLYTLQTLKNFRRDEDGAVTVDWVVLTASIVALAFVVVFAILGSTESTSERIGTFFDSRTVGGE